MFFSKVSSLVSSWLWSCQQGDVIVVSIHTICDLYHNYPYSASFSLHVHGLNSISSPIKVPACVHLDWILRSGGEGGPQPSCISSTHAKVCLSRVFFHFSCCCNFLSLSPPWYLLSPIFFSFQAVWAGQRWCEGWVNICDHGNFKAIMGKCLNNGTSQATTSSQRSQSVTITKIMISAYFTNKSTNGWTLAGEHRVGRQEKRGEIFVLLHIRHSGAYLTFVSFCTPPHY